jgi:hypothetical protein
LTEAILIAQTEAWIKSVVIGCNFCPFAAKALLKKSIRYVVLKDANKDQALESLIREMEFLDKADELETTLIILPDHFDNFLDYLHLIRSAEKTVARLGYEGLYQIASFHPEYIFADADEDDPANYTNRSPYPMIHILREESVSQAVDHYPDADNIPQQNIAFARQKGLRYMQMLLTACRKD